MDSQKIRDMIHLPEDSEGYEEDLLEILNRIPEGWGRWISCDKGWYKLLAETNKQLRYMYPEYQVHQVKEKFGTLRYYWGLPHVDELDGEDLEKREIIVNIMSAIEDQASHRSGCTCETCGERGKTRDRGGWLKTLCAVCATEQKYPLEEWEKKNLKKKNTRQGKVEIVA
jgi:hypothetical protein